MKGKRLIITQALKELGIPANLKGYRYIEYAVESLMDDIEYPITKLYKDVATKFNTKPTRAERAIRHAIELGWGRANTDFSKKMFGYSVDSNKGKPTNSEFLATVADYILMTEGL